MAVLPARKDDSSIQGYHVVGLADLTGMAKDVPVDIQDNLV